MSVIFQLKMMRLLSQLGGAEGERKDILKDRLRTHFVKARNKAKQRNDVAGYATTSTWLGEYYATTPDTSDGLRPLGCGYLAACLGGEASRADRGRAAEGLAQIFYMIGSYGHAAECVADAINMNGQETEDASFGRMLALLAAIDPDRQGSVEYVSPLLEETREYLRELGLPGHAEALALIDVRYRLRHLPFAEIRGIIDSMPSELLKPMQVEAQGILAEAAEREGHLEAAMQLIDSTIDLAYKRDFPWQLAPLLGTAARIQLARGNIDEALRRALQGWSRVLPALLIFKDDYARRCIQQLAASCIQTAIEAAYESRNWPLLAELIENSRLQVAPMSQESERDSSTSECPDWILPDSMRTLIVNGAVGAGIHAVLCGDWKSSISNPTVVINNGSRALADALRESLVEHDGRFIGVEAFSDLESRLKLGAFVWSASVRGNVLYWTISDEYGTFTGDALSLDSSPALPYLEALRQWLSPTQRAFSGIGLEDIDVQRGLLYEGELEELQASHALSSLIPQHLKDLALARNVDNPVKVLFSVPPELSTVPWAILPLSRPGESLIRLVERVELVFLTPTAVRRSAQANRTWVDGNRKVALAVCNPAGDLKDAPAVEARRVMRGVPSDEPGQPVESVAVSDFVRDVELNGWEPEDVLFVRSHLGVASIAGYVADSGIQFVDGVLSSRALSLREGPGTPALPMPCRVVLSLCSGAGSSDASGLTLGLAAACRLAGAEDVLTSTYNVLDTIWTRNFDNRLASISVLPTELSSNLRSLQLECLTEWKTSSFRKISPLRAPMPVIWGSFGVVI